MRVSKRRSSPRRRPPGPAAASARPAEHLEEVGQVAEAEIELAEVGPGERIEPGPERLVPAAVVARPLFLVREHGERLGHFLELLLGRLVALVDVGMVLAGEAPIGRLDLLRAGRPGNAQDLVVVFLGGHAPRAPPLRRRRREPTLLRSDRSRRAASAISRLLLRPQRRPCQACLSPAALIPG